ncbi:MAG: radical SAM protein, partial [Planctomycetota bacterium]
PDGVQLLSHEDILSYEEITEVVQAAAEMGVRHVRLTGGEPLTRKGIVDLIAMIAQINGIDDLSMTTNGTYLAEHAASLAAAGLRRINVSLDTLDPQRFGELTCGGDLAQVLAGIDAAEAAGLAPIKLNCVTGNLTGPEDVEAVQALGRRRGFEVRLIRHMDFQAGEFTVVEGGSGGDCPRCNRLRLSSDGHIRPCLFCDVAFSVRELGAAEALRQAAQAKPAAGGPCEHNWMRGIGG